MTDHKAIQKSFTLSLVLESVQSVLKKAYAQPYWVTCELSRISLHQQTGHCYLELVEKNNSGIMAQARGIIWANQFAYISKKFEMVTGSPISNGMQLMLLCNVSFHPLYGFSLLISDVEPSFTLGELARLKKETIEKLKNEKLFNKNKELYLPALISNIAVISVESSRGYQDFFSTIFAHPKNYNIKWTLYEAILQGENAISTITEAINKILSGRNSYDAIAIIRGGAGETGLACYDDYDLAKAVATCPLPVLTGIGHATNETIVEMVANESFITPTACAQFLLERFEAEEEAVTELMDQLMFISSNLLQKKLEALSSNVIHLRHLTLPAIKEKSLQLINDNELLFHHCRQFQLRKANNLSSFANSIRLMAQGDFFTAKKQPLHFLLEKIKTAAVQKIMNCENQVAAEVRNALSAAKVINDHSKELLFLEEKVNLLSPLQTLKRGYSITRKNGKAVTTASHLTSGDRIEIELSEGKITTTL